MNAVSSLRQLAWLLIVFVALPTSFANAASLPAGARKISTQWHPVWRLKSRVAEPFRITTHVYNGQPDPTNGDVVVACAPEAAKLPDGSPIAVLCKQVVQPTDDANGEQGFAAKAKGAPQTQSWTYNERGQVLTASEAGKTVILAYYEDTQFTGTGANAVGHTKGDLKSVSDSAGKVIMAYPQYDRNGYALQSQDASNVVTQASYTPRGLLETVRQGNETATYTYDGAGQLKKVSLSDGTWVSYDYDDAHQLVSVFNDTNPRTNLLTGSDPKPQASTADALNRRALQVSDDPAAADSGGPRNYVDGNGKNNVCIAACTAAGAIAGGFAGSMVGGVMGGAAGAATGTLVAPGFGTAGGAVAGAQAGSALGGVMGAGAGAAAGYAAGDAVCPPDDECKKLSADVQRAKDKVANFRPASCKPTMSRWEIKQREAAWLELAAARSKHDQRCWNGGNPGHQIAHSDAWLNVAKCQALLK